MTPDRTSFGVVLVLWCAGLGAAAQFGKISVTFQSLAAHYDAAGPAVGFVVSLVGFVGIVMGVTAGLLVARSGYRRALVAALVLGAAVSAYQATLPPLALMLVSRVLEGASHLAIVVAAPTLIAQLSTPRHRGLTLSLWSTFFGVAFAILAFAGLPLVQRSGIGALYAAHGVYMAATAGLIIVVLPRDVIGPTPQTINLKTLMQDHLRIYRSPNISAPALGWLFYAATFLAILTIMPAFLAPASRSFVVGAMPLAGIASSMTLGVWLLRRFRAVSIIQAGFVSCLLAGALIWMKPDQVWPYLVLAATMGLIQGASFAAVPQLNAAPDAQAQANGAMAQMGNVGTTIGTPILAALVLGQGINGFAIFVTTTFCAGLLIHIALARRRRCATL
jgi:MFS family permease